MAELFAGIDPVFLIIVCVVTFAVSTAATVAGFGLGAVLTPIFAFVYPAQLAVILVSIVHFLNNGLRLGLFYKDLDRNIALRFGLICIAFAFAGAYFQSMLHSDWLKVVMGVFLVFLGGIHYAYAGQSWRFPRGFQIAGGAISGVMGGLVGAQGTIVAAFLVNVNVVKEAFVATSTLITFTIDATRVPVYLWTQWDTVSSYLSLLAAVTAFGWLVTFVGKRFVVGISKETFKNVVNGLVALMGVVIIIQGSEKVADPAVGAAIAGAEILALVLVGTIVRRARVQIEPSKASR